MDRCFAQLTGLTPAQLVVDVGAAATFAEPRYAPLIAGEWGRLVGFEPDPGQYEHICAHAKGPRTTYLPLAVGDGRRRVLHVCSEPGLTSLLEPDPAVLDLFHGFPAWGVVKARPEIDTVRLDDVPETEGVTHLQMDIQGAELMVLQNSVKRLATACVLHLEVEFVPLYKQQPLFSEIELFLRGHGFMLHSFMPLVTRVITPLMIDNDFRKGLNQVVWADAVFVRSFTQLSHYSDAQLVTTAAILHDCYRSIDLAWRLLIEHDRRRGSGIGANYFGTLTGKKAA